MALGVVTQAYLGLRPSELLRLLPIDIIMPEDSGTTLEHVPMIVALGARGGTKLKRAQTARLGPAGAEVVQALR
eukprot:7946741-Lingulodinium_polyedra.AAC.1